MRKPLIAGCVVDARCALGSRIDARCARHRWLTICTVLLTLPLSLSASAVCYVNNAASGANTGASWADAYTDLQSALNDPNCAEVWAAQGVYKPAVNNQTISFNIRPNVAVYGGFSGSETDRNARDPVAQATILSGDVDSNDTGTNGVDADTSHIVGSNSQHIVVLDGTTAGGPITAATVLDGFILTGGYASTQNGGALWCKGNGAGHECSPTLAKLVFSGNAANNGGAMALDGYSGGICNPTLTNITFSGNSASLFGGAMYNNAQLAGSVCSPTLTNVTFSGNSSANYGGAIVNDASGGTANPILTNVTFSGNSAINGGAMFNNGVGFGFSPKLINATFNGNSATYGGAIYNLNGNVLLVNSILWGDAATTSGPEFYSVSGITDLYYSVVEGGCTANCGGTPIYTGDPLLGALADNGGFTRTLMPGAGSTAINAAPCGYGNEMPVSDQRGAVRPDSASTGSTRCDIGAVEADSLPGDLIFADRFGSSPWDDF